MANVFITGGTGYIGEAVARAFRSGGHKVTALARSAESAERLQKQGFTVVRGDIENPNSFIETLAGHDHIVHTAFANTKDAQRVDRVFVEAVLERLAGTGKTFIYTSGVWVLGSTDHVIADEQSDTNPIELVSWRPGVEHQVLEAKNKNIRSLVIRPGIVYGRDGGILSLLIERAKNDGESVYIDLGKNRWSHVHVDDLAALYVLAAEEGKAGTIYHATNGIPAAFKEIAELVAELSGHPGKTASITYSEAVERLGAIAQGFALDQHIDASKARRELSWNPHHGSIVEELKVRQKALASVK